MINVEFHVRRALDPSVGEGEIRDFVAEANRRFDAELLAQVAVLLTAEQCAAAAALAEAEGDVRAWEWLKTNLRDFEGVADHVARKVAAGLASQINGRTLALRGIRR